MDQYRIDARTVCRLAESGAGRKQNKSDKKAVSNQTSNAPFLQPNLCNEGPVGNCYVLIGGTGGGSDPDVENADSPLLLSL